MRWRTAAEAALAALTALAMAAPAEAADLGRWRVQVTGSLTEDWDFPDGSECGRTGSGSVQLRFATATAPVHLAKYGAWRVEPILTHATGTVDYIDNTTQVPSETVEPCGPLDKSECGVHPLDRRSDIALEGASKAVYMRPRLGVFAPDFTACGDGGFEGFDAFPGGPHHGDGIRVNMPSESWVKRRRSFTATATERYPYARGGASATTVRTAELRFSRQPAKLRADPGGPYTAARGRPLRLDGSRSRGDIESYEWTFDGARCDGLRADARKEGRRVQMTPVCSLRATLTVNDGHDEDSRSVAIKVRPMRPVTYRQVAPGHERQARFGFLWPLPLVFGYNRCAPDWAGNPDPDAGDHWLHPGQDFANEKGAIDIEQVSDPGGPWDGRWYVKDHHLVVDRTIVLNSRLLRGGDVYELNRASRYREDLEALVDSVRDHEQMHGTLVRRALRGAAGNPAPRFEALVGDDPDRLRLDANVEIGDAETALKEASAEVNVKAALRRKWGRRSATILIPESGGATAPHAFTSLAAIGDD